MQATSLRKDFPNETEKKFTAVLNEAGFCERPVWYAGTPADGRDISAYKLEKLHGLIDKAYGTKAAEAYICTVATIPYLAPTDFVQALWDLHNCDWNYRGSAGMNGLSVETEDAAFVSNMSLSFGYAVNKTEELRAPFVRNHLSVVQARAELGDKACARTLQEGHKYERIPSCFYYR